MSVVVFSPKAPLSPFGVYHVYKALQPRHQLINVSGMRWHWIPAYSSWGDCWL